MREQVNELLKLGPLPSSEASAETIGRYQELLSSITPPVTNEEARHLTSLFGPDDCYGLAWTLVHLIESAPNWPVEEYLEGENEWIGILRDRAR
jgi:hypothetical protein